MCNVINRSDAEFFTLANKCSAQIDEYNENNISKKSGVSPADIQQEAKNSVFLGELLTSQRSLNRPVILSQNNENEVKVDQKITESLKTAERLDSIKNTSPFFKNLIGDYNNLVISGIMVNMMNTMRSVYSLMATKSVEFMVNAAKSMGFHHIEAAKENFKGAIIAATAGTTLQAGGTTAALKGMNDMSRSTRKNLLPAQQKQKALENDKKMFKEILDKKNSEGTQADPQMISMMNKHQNNLESNIQELNNKHRKVENKAQKYHLSNGPLNQASHSVSQIINSGYGVNAAGETRNAGLSETDKQINSQTADNLKQSAIAADNNQSTFNKTLDDIFRSRNNALDAVVSKIH
ncbi:type III secretion system protein [Erwinia amylovora]|uniref:type III secretion system protein n=1 Tax=Erwinia amylovora TaxID=552 RepID=UPI000C073EF2|nr:type III secretion system protein [Erwinia amylovora]MBZ2397907.1 type III secretion system protein [Erwinia amylovora]MBZ2401482.1 type III secretion system protein [Erwinia amylovora]